MNLVVSALKRPITVVTLIAALVMTSLGAVNRMRKDIFPALGIPIIYLAQNYQAMTPDAMQTFFAYYFEFEFLFVDNLQSIEDKVTQGALIMKLLFHPGTDMGVAMAQVASYVRRAMAFQPPGVLPPFVRIYSASSVPLGYLVFMSTTTTVAHLQDEALNRVRPYFATLPGVSSPPPFGAAERTIVLYVNPAKLRKYNLSGLDVTRALADAERIMPAGNIRTFNRQAVPPQQNANPGYASAQFYPLIPTNYWVNNIQDLKMVPIRPGTTPTVYIGDVADIRDASNIPVGYAEINSHRGVYIPVIKRADASSLTVVDEVKKALPKFRELVPPSMHITLDYLFDQSVYIVNAIKSLFSEGVVEALLVALMVFLFLRDPKTVLIVALNIPLSVMGAILLLWLSGQTVNVMTLGGLALSIAILVDQGIVVIENIHTHLHRGKSIAYAAMDGALETAVPNLLATACIMSVFIPALLMTGVSKALFTSLSLAVGYALLNSFVLSSTLIPIAAVRFRIKASHSDHNGPFERFRKLYTTLLGKLLKWRVPIAAAYLAMGALGVWWLFTRMGRDIFPAAEANQFRMHLSAPAGTVIEKTEEMTNKALEIVRSSVGEGNVQSTLGYVGMVPPFYSVNLIYQWSSGPQDSLNLVTLNPKKRWDIPALKETLRQKFARALPDMHVSFEPSDIISRILAQGSPTPVELAVTGVYWDDIRHYAKKFYQRMKTVSELRDVEYEEPLDYPAVKIDISRELAGNQGLTIHRVGDSIEDYTTSSRYDFPIFWADQAHAVSYQMQVEVDQHLTHTLDDIGNIPVPLSVGQYSGALPLQQFATATATTTVGQYDRFNGQRMILISANIHGTDLWHASRKVQKIIDELAPERPRGVWVMLRGQVPALNDMFGSLAFGIVIAIGIILILLTAYFQSPMVALSVVSTAPAVIIGCGLALLLTGDTLNMESLIGMIMALGVASANAILFCAFAERHRRDGADSVKAAMEGGSTRLRPILITALAMIVGMLPMAIGLSESGKQEAPLGRAVCGGILFATFATLLVLPSIYAILQRRARRRTPSMDPRDPEGSYYEPKPALQGANGAALPASSETAPGREAKPAGQ